MILDTPAAALDRIYVSAGRRGLQVSLRPDDLVDLVDPIVAAVSAE